MSKARTWFVVAGALVLGVALVLAGGCGDDEGEEEATATQPAAGETPAEGAALGVVLSEWAIEPEADSVAAGAVTFQAENRGDLPHELEIFATDVDPATVPIEEEKAVVEGEEIGEIEEGELPSGGQAEATFDLEAGTYLLICNIAGHYEQRMYAQLTVE
ncbi:MAG: sulfocyanin-like copper-binding protein [Dehalococcoidia bacterium]|nr:sulfocyanin-like copper-binding protein [Dehalococcoidia bacterium]